MAPKHSVTVMDIAPSSSAGSHGGRGRGRHRGRGRGRGRGGHSTRLATSPDSSPPSSPERVDFKVEIISASRRWVRLPDSFAKVMVASRPSGLWLRSEGCPHGPIWVDVDFSENNAMYLEKGWKTFLRSRNISEGRTIIFPMMGMRPFGPSSLMVMVIESSAVSRVRVAVTKISMRKLKKPPSRLNLKMMTEASVL